MSIHDLVAKIEAEVMTYNHVRDTETHMVADLVVWVKNMLEDQASVITVDTKGVSTIQSPTQISK